MIRHQNKLQKNSPYHSSLMAILCQLKNKQHNAKWGDFKIAVPIALGFAVLFVVLQKMGIVNLVSAGNVTYGTAFVIGIIASLSTCMAVVGGLVLSMSATFAKEGDKVRPQLMFHGGRIASFFILGGVIRCNWIGIYAQHFGNLHPEFDYWHRDAHSRYQSSRYFSLGKETSAIDAEVYC